MQDFQNKILNIINKSKKIETCLIAEIHDLLMSEYGWIPLEEFKRLPINTVSNLLEAAERRREEEARIMKEKQKSGRGKHV